MGELFHRVSEELAERTLQKAWDGGVRYFDTAPGYGRGRSERLVGDFLRGHKRDEYILSTKVGRLLEPDASVFKSGVSQDVWLGGDPNRMFFDYTEAAIIKSHQDSLQRMGADRVDFLLIHDLDFKHHGDEAGVNNRFNELTVGRGWKALCDLKQSGAISAIGAGINRVGLVPLFLERGIDVDFFLIAGRYTLLDQSALETGEMQACQEHGISVVIGGPFNSGILATGPSKVAKFNYADASDEVLQKVGRLKAVCDKYDVPLGAAAIQFVLAHPIVASVIPGHDDPQMFAQNLAYYKQSIPEDLWHDLKREGCINPAAPIPVKAHVV